LKDSIETDLALIAVFILTEYTAFRAAENIDGLFHRFVYVLSVGLQHPFCCLMDMSCAGSGFSAVTTTANVTAAIRWLSSVAFSKAFKSLRVFHGVATSLTDCWLTDLQ
jgi:hypothetical protein